MRKKLLNVGSIFLLCFLIVSSFLEAAIFGNLLSLSDFGQRSNKNTNLQPSARLTAASPLRTNDYQTLQLAQTNRSTTRMGGPYLISQGGTGLAINGPGITFPAHIFVDASPNPAQNFTASVTETRLIFGCTETATFNVTSEIGSAAGQSDTFQSFILRYTNPGNASQFIEDYNVIGNAFHDMSYTDLTPHINLDPFTKLIEVTVFSTAIPAGQTFTPPPDVQTLPAGNKFRIKVENTQTNNQQTWLIYVEPPVGSPGATPTVTFEAAFNLAAGNGLVGQNTLDGFLRVAIVQSTPVPVKQNPNFPSTQPPLGPVQEVADWSTALGIQSIAAAPGSMFILWPKDWVGLAGDRIKKNIGNGVFLPFCPWVSNFLAVLARSDLQTAKNYFHALQDKGSSSFGLGQNPFIAYFNMLLASLMDSDINTYQTTQRPPPSYSISATDQTIEAEYDSHRTIIPIDAELSFADGTYTWTYTNSNALSAPLINFPAYKTLSSTSSPNLLSDFLIEDPFKGRLLGITATGNEIEFQEGALPSFLLTQGSSDPLFIPDDFWDKINSEDQAMLLSLFQKLTADFNSSITNPPSPPANSLGYTLGQVNYQYALVLRYAVYMLEKIGKTPSEVKAETEVYANALKAALESWLINRQKTIRDQNGGTLPDSAINENFFVGDSTVGGICTSLSGMEGTPIAGLDDFGNAFYNDHHFLNGYWLGSAAAIVAWDNKFYNIAPNPVATPWIATTFTTSTGVTGIKMKAFVDLLWRDTRDPDTTDPDFPYNRHGNPWEGHSTALGTINGLAQANGRNQESLAEDFNNWLNVLVYAQEILNSPGLNATDTMGFSTLIAFCKTNLALTATGGTVYYNTPRWPFANRQFNFDVVVGNTWDSLADSNVFFNPGTPACTITKEDIIFSNSRLNSFYDGYVLSETEILEALR